MITLTNNQLIHMKIKIPYRLLIMLLLLSTPLAAQSIQDATEKKAITWTSNDTTVTGFSLVIQPFNSTNTIVKWFDIPDAAARSVNITNLFNGIPEGVYDVRAYAVNALGARSEPSNAISVNWFITKPRPVTFLRTINAPVLVNATEPKRAARSPRGKVQ